MYALLVCSRTTWLRTHLCARKPSGRRLLFPISKTAAVHMHLTTLDFCMTPHKLATILSVLFKVIFSPTIVQKGSNLTYQCVFVNSLLYTYLSDSTADPETIAYSTSDSCESKSPCSFLLTKFITRSRPRIVAEILATVASQPAGRQSQM